MTAPGSAAVAVSLPAAAPHGHLAVRLARPAVSRSPGLAVLYCHGFGSSQAGDKATFFGHRFVAAGIPFCSFDFQSHGASGGEFVDLTLSRNVGDIGRVHDWLRSEGLPRVLLVASSMGGGAALWYAARRPADVVAGLHVAPAIDLGARLLAEAGEEGIERWRREGRRRIAHPLVDCDLGWGLVEDLSRHPPVDLAAATSVPTLLLQGVEDTAVDWRVAVELVAACRGGAVELCLLADGDHRLLDRKDHLFRLMLGFLEARGLLPAVEARR